MINEIKQIIENYLNNRKLVCLMIGTVSDSGIKINDKLTIPFELTCGNLKKSMAAGDKVRLLRNDGGQMFYILEVISS